MKSLCVFKARGTWKALPACFNLHVVVLCRSVTESNDSQFPFLIVYVLHVSLKLYLIYSAKFNVLLFGYFNQHLNKLVHRLLELNF